jgi:hypothetical protein
MTMSSLNPNQSVVSVASIRLSFGIAATICQPRSRAAFNARVNAISGGSAIVAGRMSGYAMRCCREIACPWYSTELGDPCRSGIMATNRGGFSVSVVMSWIGGDALALCNMANGTPNATAPTTAPANAKAKPRLCAPGRVIHPPIRATKTAPRPIHAPQRMRANASVKSINRSLYAGPAPPTINRANTATIKPTTATTEGFSARPGDIKANSFQKSNVTPVLDVHQTADVIGIKPLVLRRCSEANAERPRWRSAEMRATY